MSYPLPWSSSIAVLELGHRGADVGQLDDVRLGLLGELPELGQRVGDALPVVETVGELGQDPAGQRDVAVLDLDVGRPGERPQDRQQRVRGQRRRLVGQGVDDLHRSGTLPIAQPVERLGEVRPQVLDGLEADAQAKQSRGHPRRAPTAPGPRASRPRRPGLSRSRSASGRFSTVRPARRRRRRTTAAARTRRRSAPRPGPGPDRGSGRGGRRDGRLSRRASSSALADWRCTRSASVFMPAQHQPRRIRRGHDARGRAKRQQAGVVLGAGAAHHPEQRVVVAGQDLRRAVQHEVRAVLERAQQDRAEHGVVDHDERAGGVGAGDRGVEVGKLIIGFAHGSSHTRSALGGSPVWSKAPSRGPSGRAPSWISADRPPVATVGDRHRGAGLAEGEHAARWRRPSPEENSSAWPPSSSPSIRSASTPDRMGVALVVERPGRGVDVRLDRGAGQRRHLATGELRLALGHGQAAARRGNSIAGQRFITTSRPASSARWAAASSITPSCIHTAPDAGGDRLVDVGAGPIGPAEDVDDVDAARSPECR